MSRQSATLLALTLGAFALVEGIRLGTGQGWSWVWLLGAATDVWVAVVWGVAVIFVLLAWFREAGSRPNSTESGD